MISANGGLPAHRYTPQVTQRWPRGSEPASQVRNSSSQQQCPCEKRWTLRRQWLQHLEFSAMSTQRNRRRAQQKNCGNGLKQGDQGARLLFVFFLILRKNERTRCSVEKAIATEGKRWVGVLMQEAWRLFFADARPRSSIPGKTRVSCCGTRKWGAASHFSKVRSGAIQRTFAEGEGRSQLTDYMEQNTPTVGCVADGHLVQQTVCHKSCYVSVRPFEHGGHTFKI